MTESFLTLINPAAGSGKCGRLAGSALRRLSEAGIPLEIVRCRYPGHATELARDGYRKGFRRFLAVGGDGTCYEVLNGLFPAPPGSERPTLALLPLGTGNSFLRDFSDRGATYTMEAIREGRSRLCDLLCLTHKSGRLYSMNLISMGFAADVATLTNRRFKGLGELGYLLSLIFRLIRLRRRPFPHRVDGETEWDRRPCLFLTFNNSKFTGGKMMIAPQADSHDGLIEFVRWGPIGRMGLLRNLPTLYDGTHLNHPLASRRPARRIDFQLDEPVDIMVDGEVLSVHCESLEIVAEAITVMV